MSTATRAERMPIAEVSAQITELRDNFAALYTRGVERLGEMEKRSIDLALQHNQEAVGLWKQVAEKLPWAPRLSAFEQTATALERIAETQKAAIDMLVGQTRAAVEMVKEGAASWKKTSESAFSFAQESFEQAVTAQRKAAEAVVNQSKVTFDKAREEFDFPGSQAVADSIRRSVDSVVEAQKAVLETVAS